MRQNTPIVSVLLAVLLAAVACESSSSSGTSDLPNLGDPSYGEINEAQVRRMVETDPADDGPFHMINLIKFREKAVYRDGRETELTGREADALYAPFEFLQAIGAEIAFVGEVETNLISIEGTQWEQVAIAKYPSRALFFQMTQDEEFRARAIHKDAGVEKSLVMVGHLQEQTQPPKPNPIPHPATPEDPAVAIAHLLKYNETADYGLDSSEPERTGREAMSLYEQAATPVALEQGVGPISWFEIEGVFIGDGREFDEFRINVFPSHTAFDAVVANPARLAGQVHREAALEDTYTTANAIVIDSLGGEAGGGLLEITANGTGTLCAIDANCAELGADTCLSDGGTGFCTVEGCTAGSCEGSYLCCHDCADFAADLLPFDGSACLPASQTEVLTGTPGCTCE